MTILSEGFEKTMGGIADGIGEAIIKVFDHVKLVQSMCMDDNFKLYQARVVRLLRTRNAHEMGKVVSQLGDLADCMIQAAEEQDIIAADGDQE